MIIPVKFGMLVRLAIADTKEDNRRGRKGYRVSG